MHVFLENKLHNFSVQYTFWDFTLQLEVEKYSGLTKMYVIEACKILQKKNAFGLINMYLMRKYDAQILHDFLLILCIY